MSEQQQQKKKRMTPAQWAEARAMWVSGEFSQDQIAEKFGVARETVSRRFNKEGIEKGQVKIDKQVEAEIVSKAMLNADKWAERGEHVRETYYKTAETLRNMAIKTLADAMKSGGAFAAQPDLKAIGMCVKTIEELRRGQWEITGLDKQLPEEDDIPELMVRSLTEEDIERIRRMQQAPMDDEIEIGDAIPYLEDAEEELEGLVVEGDE